MYVSDCAPQSMCRGQKTVAVELGLCLREFWGLNLGTLPTKLSHWLGSSTLIECKVPNYYATQIKCVNYCIEFHCNSIKWQ